MRVLATVLLGAGGWLWWLDPNTGSRRLARVRGVRRRQRRELRHRWGHDRRPARSSVAEVPPALDLLAACLSAGTMLEPALSAVALAFDGPTGDLLSAIARLTALGAPPEDAWSAALRDERWAPVARSVIRAHHSGAALTDVLNRAASELRRDLRTKAEAAAAQASVRAVLPLGLCFLPAFLLVGVVPVVAGFANSLR